MSKIFKILWPQYRIKGLMLTRQALTIINNEGLASAYYIKKEHNANIIA